MYQMEESQHNFIVQYVECIQQLTTTLLSIAYFPPRHLTNYIVTPTLIISEIQVMNHHSVILSASARLSTRQKSSIALLIG